MTESKKDPKLFYFEIPGEPVPWAAPRMGRHHAYSPKGKEKEVIRQQIALQAQSKKLNEIGPFRALLQENDEEMIHGACVVDMIFYRSVPKSASKRMREAMLAGDIRPVTKPDATNCAKLAEDCLKGIVMKDDAQVVDIRAQKFYAEKGYTIIQVREICP